MKKRVSFLLCAVLMLSVLSGCGNTNAAAQETAQTANSAETAQTADENTDTTAQNAQSEEASTSASGNNEAAAKESTDTAAAAQSTSTWEVDLDMIDMDAWQYDSSTDVYWQVGVSYCANPADENYETLGMFVPGAYMNGVKNADGTYSCTVNEEGTVNGYTAETAPILFPVNTPGHKAQDAPDSYSKKCSTYTDQGYIYVQAGCRGKDAGVPSGVADLKAAIRYIRYNEELLPGSTDRILVFGHSGGGSQCAVLGSSGDSELYTPYLEALGAAPTSDAVAAVMCWCPITSYDSSDMGYEWNMGMTRSGLSDEMQTISDELAAAYADYVNSMGFTDEDGNLLTLEESPEGIYQAGSYYGYVKDTIEESLEHYLQDTTFPTSGKSGSYSSAEDYISSLNSDEEWVSYDSATGEVTVTSVAAFSEHCKQATKPIAAFDKLEEGGHELFNTGSGEKMHYDSVLYEIIKGTSYEEEFAEDLSGLDSLGNTVEYRLNMFSPLYYLMEANEGYNTSTVASNWRIRTGITQSDTPLTTEINLALALESEGADVDFETVWNQGHTQAERTGKSTDNLIEWIDSLWK